MGEPVLDLDAPPVEAPRPRRRLLLALAGALALVVVAVGTYLLRSPEPVPEPGPLWTVPAGPDAWWVTAGGETVALVSRSRALLLDRASGRAVTTIHPGSGEFNAAHLTGTSLVLGTIDEEAGTATWTVVDTVTTAERFTAAFAWPENGANHLAVTDRVLASVACPPDEPGECRVSAHDLVSGGEVWSGTVCGGPEVLLAGPTAVFTGCGTVPVDLNTGARLTWEPTERVRVCGDVLVDDGGDGVLRRIDPATGRELWRADWTACTGHQGYLHDPGDPSRILDAATGRAWSLPAGTSFAGADGDTLIALTDTRALIGVRGGEQVWRSELGPGGDLSPLVGPGAVMAGDETRTWTVSVATGKTRELTGERPLAVAGGLVLTLLPDGSVRARTA